ncbi:MAG: response regulator [Chthoniobacterales bacterium]
MHAPRGQVGVEMAGAYQPQLVLLDLNLPDMNGAEGLHRLQQQRTTADIPVVILSADATRRQIERLLTAGARNYLTKPFDIDPFLAVVDEFVTISRAV